MVGVISGIIGMKAVYMRLPTCAYAISNFTVSREGTLVWDERSSEELVDAKESLIKKALAVDILTIETDGEKVSFPWFAEGQDSESVKAYTHFIAAICDMARNQKRVTEKEKPADNEKYAFRCFLLCLGSIGAEYKGERKILLKNLSGSSAFKNAERGNA